MAAPTGEHKAPVTNWLRLMYTPPEVANLSREVARLSSNMATLNNRMDQLSGKADEINRQLAEVLVLLRSNHRPASAQTLVPTSIRPSTLISTRTTSPSPPQQLLIQTTPIATSASTSTSSAVSRPTTTISTETKESKSPPTTPPSPTLTSIASSLNLTEWAGVNWTETHSIAAAGPRIRGRSASTLSLDSNSSTDEQPMSQDVLVEGDLASFILTQQYEFTK